jgi:hypothetical protein
MLISLHQTLLLLLLLEQVLRGLQGHGFMLRTMLLFRLQEDLQVLTALQALMAHLLQLDQMDMVVTVVQDLDMKVVMVVAGVRVLLVALAAVV